MTPGARRRAPAPHPYRQHPPLPDGAVWWGDWVHVKRGAARGHVWEMPWWAWGARGQLRKNYLRQAIAATLQNEALKPRARQHVAAILEALL